MRDIKFRAWDTKHEEWLCEQEMPILNDTNNKIWEFGDTDHCRFMQYTGLKDKTGKEIYEGDILRSLKNCVYPRGFEVGEVYFRNGCFRIRTVALTTIVSAFEPEIIGNVHQHPELLG